MPGRKWNLTSSNYQSLIILRFNIETTYLFFVIEEHKNYINDEIYFNRYQKPCINLTMKKRHVVTLQ